MFHKILWFHNLRFATPNPAANAIPKILSALIVNVQEETEYALVADLCLLENVQLINISHKHNPLKICRKHNPLTILLHYCQIVMITLKIMKQRFQAWRMKK